MFSYVNLVFCERYLRHSVQNIRRVREDSDVCDRHFPVDGDSVCDTAGRRLLRRVRTIK